MKYSKTQKMFFFQHIFSKKYQKILLNQASIKILTSKHKLLIYKKHVLIDFSQKCSQQTVTFSATFLATRQSDKSLKNETRRRFFGQSWFYFSTYSPFRSIQRVQRFSNFLIPSEKYSIGRSPKYASVSAMSSSFE